MLLFHCLSIYTGDTRYPDFAYLDNIAYVEEVFHFHFLHYIVIQLRVCRNRLSRKTCYLEVVFHARALFFTKKITGYAKVNIADLLIRHYCVK